MATFRREFFRRGDTFVVVRYIRLTSKVRLEPGTVIEPGQYRLFQLRNWWNRRQIGVKDSKWVAENLKRFGIGVEAPKAPPKGDPSKLSELEPYKQGTKWVIPGFEDSISFKTKKAAVQWLAEEEVRREAAGEGDEEEPEEEVTEEEGEGEETEAGEGDDAEELAAEATRTAAQDDEDGGDAKV